MLLLFLFYICNVILCNGKLIVRELERTLEESHNKSIFSFCQKTLLKNVGYQCSDGSYPDKKTQCKP